MAVLFFGFRYLWVRIPVVNGYAAKNLCSAVFIADRDAQNVIDNELDYSFVKYASASVDNENRSASASFFGMRSQTAYYNEDCGCILADEKVVDDLNLPISSNYASDVFKVTDSLKVEYDKEKLDFAVNQFFVDDKPEQPYGTRAVVVIKKGKLVKEQYAEGFDASSKHIGWSMTKSIFNALVGIAIKDGKIESVQDLMPFKSWANTKKAEITWDDVLRMNTGIQWNEDYGNPSEVTAMLYESEDMVEVTSALGLEAKPGEHWEYSSGMSNLLSGGLREVYGDDEYWKLPYHRLFGPLGMSSMFLETDGAGNYVGSSYSWATARDWAKFGQLYLQDGMWQGERLLPTNWVNYTTTVTPGSNGRYGAQWWLPIKERMAGVKASAAIFPNMPNDMYYADGFQGQRIFVFPSQELVVVRLGLSKLGDPDYDALLQGILEAINE